jgi:hypothetical protein
MASDGTLRRGVLVRHVMAPLPAEERAAIDAVLAALPDGIRVARASDFVDLEARRQTMEQRP